jgi:hypothetical protein
MTSRPSTAAPILAVLAIVLVTLGAYVGGYFWLGEYSPSVAGFGFAPATTRVYHARSYSVFVPLAWFESKLTRREVTLVYEEGGDFLEAFSIGDGD